MVVVIPIGNILAAYVLIGIFVTTAVMIQGILDLNDITNQARKSHFIHPLRFVILWPIVVTQTLWHFIKWFSSIDP